MTINVALTKNQYIRLAILRHIQRKHFYFYAILCAAFSAYAFIQGPQMLLLVAWVPFLLYLGVGIFDAVREGTNPNNPLLLPTRYTFSKKGVAIKGIQGESELQWSHFNTWKVVANCYVLALATGPILAIPQIAIPTADRSKFEALLSNQID